MRRLVLAATFLVLLLAGALTAARLLWLTPERLRAAALDAIGKRFSGKVELGEIHLEGLCTVALRGFTLASPDGLAQFARIGALRVTPSIGGALMGQIRLTSLVVEGMDLDVRREPTGRFEIERYLRREGATGEPAVGGAAPDAGGQQPPQLASAGTVARVLAIDRWVIHGSKIAFASKALSLGLTRIEAAGAVDDALTLEGLSARLFDRFEVTASGTLDLDEAGAYRVQVRLPEADLKELLGQAPEVGWWMKTMGEDLAARLTLRVEGQGDREHETVSLEAQARDLVYDSPGVLGGQLTSAALVCGLAYRRTGSAGTLDGTVDMSAPGFQPASYPQGVVFERLTAGFDWTHPVLRVKTLHLTGTGAKPATGNASMQGVVDGAGFVNLGRMPPDYELSFEGQGLSAPAVLGPVWTAAGVVAGTRADMAGRLLPGELSLRTLALRLPGVAGALAGGAAPIGPQWGVAPPGAAGEEPSIAVRGRLQRGMGGVWTWRDGVVRLRTSGPILFSLLGLAPPPLSGDLALEGSLEGTTTAATLQARFLPCTLLLGRGQAALPLAITDGEVAVGAGALRLGSLQMHIGRAAAQVSGAMTSASRRLGLSFDLLEAPWTALGKALGVGQLVAGVGSLTGALGVDDRGFDARGVLSLAPATLYLGVPVPGISGDGNIPLESLKASLELAAGRVRVWDLEAMGALAKITGSVTLEPDGRLEGGLYVRPNVPSVPAETLTISGTRDAPVIAPGASPGGHR